MNSPERIIAEKGFYSALVQGKSMLPLLHDRTDSVYIEKCVELKKLDIALFRRKNGKLVLHRVVGFEGDKLVFVGDNDFVREIVDKTQIIGKMTEFCRNGKNRSINNFGYRIYSRVWCFSFPTKRFLKFVYMSCNRFWSLFVRGG